MSWLPYVIGTVVAIALLWMIKPLLALYVGPTVQLTAAEPPQDQPSIHQFTPLSIDGQAYPLADHAGQVLLVVNTASKCGLTSQYTGLQQLHRQFADRGFSVIAFPCNDFLGQEPGSAEDIQSFCTTNYAVTFPLMAKINVKGEDTEPLYSYLINDSPFPGKIRWNFDKFLVDTQGRVVGRFSPRTEPMDAKLVEAVEALLPTAVGGQASGS